MSDDPCGHGKCECKWCGRDYDHREIEEAEEEKDDIIAALGGERDEALAKLAELQPLLEAIRDDGCEDLDGSCAGDCWPCRAKVMVADLAVARTERDEALAKLEIAAKVAVSYAEDNVRRKSQVGK